MGRAVLALVLLLAGAANAQSSRSDAPTCSEPVREWAQTCSAQLRAHFCDAGIIVFDAEVEARWIRLELREDTGAVQIVGEQADVAAYPPAAALRIADLEACGARDSPFSLSNRELDRAGPELSVGGLFPWSFVLACLLFIALLVRQRRRLRGVIGGDVLAKFVVLLLAGAIIGALLEPAFAHMNGQGPLWVDYALGLPSQYGPGFRELYGLATLSAGEAPEVGLFAMQTLLLAFVPALVFLLARGAGASLSLSAAATLLALADPMRARLSGSESYFASGYVLVAAACAALVWGWRSPVPSKQGRINALLGTLAAGAFIAQAARLHPILWLPCATVPMVMLALPGTTRVRIRQMVIAGIGVGVVVALLAGATMLETLLGPMGRWSGGTGSAMSSVGVAWPVLVGGLIVVLLSTARRRALVLLGGALLCLAVASLALHLSSFPDRVAAAHHRVFAPVLVPLLSGLLVTVRATRLLKPAMAVVIIGVAVFAWKAPVWLQLPTDALEQRWVLSWRDELPPGSTIAYLDRTGDRVLFLPIFQAIASHPRIVHDPSRADYIYLGSLCKTHEGEAECASMSAIPHEEIRSHVVPAIESYVGFGYTSDPVHLHLLRRIQ